MASGIFLKQQGRVYQEERTPRAEAQRCGVLTQGGVEGEELS